MNEIPENPPLISEVQESIPTKKSSLVLSLSVLSLLIALAALVVVFTMSKSGKSEEPKTIPGGKITIAWVNIDSVLEQYEFVKDVNTGLLAYEKNLQNQLAASYAAFETEYNEYIKKASDYKMTLEEQKKTEEKLSKKQQALQEMDGQLSQQLMNEKNAREREVHDSIVSFIARYNKKYQYTFILERSYGGGLLWADSTLELTTPVINGLNENYQSIKKQKEQEKDK